MSVSKDDLHRAREARDEAFRLEEQHHAIARYGHTVERMEHEEALHRAKKAQDNFDTVREMFERQHREAQASESKGAEPQPA